MRTLAAMTSAALALAASPGASAQDSWHCGGVLNGDDFSGTYTQPVEAPDLVGPLFVEISDEAGFKYSWSYANRFTDTWYETGMWGGRLADFENGTNAFPEMVSSLTLHVDHPARGALWAHYYGDGDHKLTELWHDRLRVREEFYGRKVTTNLHVSRPALAVLGDSKLWQVAITDEVGRTVAEQSFVPVDFKKVRSALGTAMERHYFNMSEYKDRCEYHDSTPVL